MKKSSIIIIPIIIVLAIIFGSNNNDNWLINQCKTKFKAQLSQKEKLDDFEQMYNILKDNYPFFEVNKRLYNTDWLSNKESYIEKIKVTRDDYEFYQTLQEILRDLHNGHTTVVTADFYNYLEKDYLSNRIYFKPWLDIIYNKKVVDRYKRMQAKTEEALSNSMKYNIVYENIRTEMIAEENVAYLAVKSFNLQYIESDSKNIREFLNKAKDCQAIIIDIRGNNGGSELYWKENIIPILIDKPFSNTTYLLYRGGEYTEKMLKYRGMKGYSDCLSINKIDEEGLSKLLPEINEQFKYFTKHEKTIIPKDSINYKGNIYLLVDRHVYSSSESFAIFAESTGFATLIGETTGGDGIGIDPALCILPNSGYLFRYSQTMGLISDGTCNEEFKTQPDIGILDAQKRSKLTSDMVIKKVLQVENLEY